MKVRTRKRKNVTPPAHHVYRILTPDLRVLTGWRCRTTLPSIASTRFRFVFGMPTRKMDFQSWLSTIGLLKSLPPTTQSTSVRTVRGLVTGSKPGTDAERL